MAKQLAFISARRLNAIRIDPHVLGAVRQEAKRRG
jgi:hypothetical protein